MNIMLIIGIVTTFVLIVGTMVYLNMTTDNTDPTTDNTDPTTDNTDPTTDNTDSTTDNTDSTTDNTDSITDNTDSTTEDNFQPTNYNTTIDETENMVDCVGSWGEWGACSTSCGSGKRSRTYTITTQASDGGALCAFQNGEVQEENCNVECWQIIPSKHLSHSQRHFYLDISDNDNPITSQFATNSRMQNMTIAECKEKANQWSSCGGFIFISDNPNSDKGRVRFLSTEIATSSEMINLRSYTIYRKNDYRYLI